MPLNIEPQEDGSIRVDDESDSGIGYRFDVRFNEHDQIVISDQFQGESITMSTWIAGGVVNALELLLEVHERVGGEPT